MQQSDGARGGCRVGSAGRGVWELWQVRSQSQLPGGPTTRQWGTAVCCPRVAITVGDPAGIGPEISLKAASHPDVLAVCEPVLYGPTSESQLERFDAGRVSAEAGQCAYDAIVRAVADAQAGRSTRSRQPINKEAFAAAGIPWRGHTELLAHLTGTSRFAMMFYAEELRVILATVHIPLAEVPRTLTRDRLESIVMLAAEQLPQFGLSRARLAVAGLNPHAGEHGVIGTEDDEVIRPAIEACRARGVDVHGRFRPTPSSCGR